MFRRWTILALGGTVAIVIAAIWHGPRHNGTQGTQEETRTHPGNPLGKPADAGTGALPMVKNAEISGIPGAAHPDSEADEEKRVTLIREWTARAPRDAAAWTESLPDGAAKVNLLQHVAIVWAEHDSTSALDWALTLPVGVGREAAIAAVGYEAVRSAPTNAIKAAEHLDSGPERNQLYCHAVSQWAAVAPWAALEWAQTIPQGGLRDDLFANIALAWAKLDGASAALLASQAIRADETGHRAVVAVVQRWSRVDPAAARSWVEQMADSTLRSKCLEVIAKGP